MVGLKEASNQGSSKRAAFRTSDPSQIPFLHTMEEQQTGQ